MADEEPPVETVQFDENFDVAVVYKCAGLNQRRTFNAHPSSISCHKIRTTKITKFGHQKLMCHSYPMYSGDNAKPCRRLHGVSFAFVTGHSRPWTRSCSKRILNTTIQNRRGTRCKIIKTPAIQIKGRAFTCRVSGKKFTTVAPLFRRYSCNRQHVISEKFKTAHFRRSCGVFPAYSQNTKWACKTYLRTLFLYKPAMTSLGRCKKPTQIKANEILVRAPCKVFGFIRLDHRAAAPRYHAWSCRVYPGGGTIQVVQRMCNVTKSIPANMFSYVVRQTSWDCRFYPLVNIVSKRFYCGNRMLTVVDMRAFGRTWGGRPADDIIVRESGRMVGKFR